MTLREVEVVAGKEPREVHGRALVMGEDLVVLLWGGSAHLGAVGVAQPRPSRRDAHRQSATASVLTLLGHREDVVVKRISERLAAALGRPVVVCAGLHWDDLPESEILAVVADCDECAELLLEKIRVER